MVNVESIAVTGSSNSALTGEEVPGIDMSSAEVVENREPREECCYISKI